MGIVRRHPRIRHVGEHLIVVANLEFLRKTVEPELSDLFADAAIPLDQIL
jgi:hypothetical protein